jgi:putative ABC transport system permease protein
MFRNYWRTALRVLSRNKTFSAINIFGLTLGTLCCLYIVLYVTDQYGYDRQHRRVGDLYRIDSHLKTVAAEDDRATVTGSVAPQMKQEFPEVEQFTRVIPFLGVERHLLHYKEKTLFEKEAVYVDSTFFDVFNFHFVEGDMRTAMMEPYSVVLLQSVAERLFGKEDAIGKTITIENVFFKTDYVVKGVIDESLGKSHIHAGIFLAMNSGFMGEYVLHTSSWTWNGYISSYVRLRPHADTASLARKLPAFVNKYGGNQLKAVGVEERLFLEPVSKIHTNTGPHGPQFSTPVSPVFLRVLLSIALLIQLIACINFMNLSTARAIRRAKEVGVRKVVGAERRHLLRQFLGESLLLSSLGFVIAIPLLILALPWLNGITAADISWTFLLQGRVWLILGILIPATGLVAGSYPAFYLSAFKALQVMKGNFTNQISAAGLRRGLVVFQFVLSIVLIIGIVVINSQLNYIRNKDLGFDKEQRLVFTFQTQDAIGRVPAFINDLRGLAAVKDACDASTYLSGLSFYSNDFWLKGQRKDQGINTSFVVSDDHFVPTNGIRLVSGRNLRSTDSARVLINETYARRLGLNPQTAPGLHLYDSQSREAEIVGVMKDFNYSKLDKAPENFLIWMMKPNWHIWPIVIANTSSSDYRHLLGTIETIWHRDVPGTPFTYSFMDEVVQKQYEGEITMSRIIRSFTFIAILISCLGLFGLASFNAEQRKKEIGIRKVLGASVPRLTRLLSMEFLRLVFIAFLIAAPVAGWVMTRWLREFAYRINLQWWMFALAGAMAVLIALVTVGYQAVRAALGNPVKALGR